ncbi:MAG: hypothetical protein MPW16_17095 [Candidatus Manganitrophus sp.]|nr:MAG: hypothetical protein MPW16_17095 [Candidatus Manganitrophus sp.]
MAEWLQKRYQVTLADSKEALHQPFDLGMIDGPALRRLSKEIQIRKAAERPRFLPFILAVSRPDVNLFKQHLWESVDELIIHPVDQMELQVRIEVLLRSRQFSSELKLRNDDLEAYSQALMHDLRAPVRAVGSFAKLLIEEQKEKLDERGKHHLDRIQSVAEQAWDMIDALLNFSRLGTKRDHASNGSPSIRHRILSEELARRDRSGQRTNRHPRRARVRSGRSHPAEDGFK